jgi:diacylglycerol kinase (ATP)
MTQPHPLNNGTGPMRAWRALLCSAQGLKASYLHESAFRQELALACVFFPAGIWLGQDLTQKLFLCALVVIVLIVELLNSAIEATVDRIGMEHHELSGRAKDMGSAAVMLSLIMTGVAFLLVAAARFT